MTLIIAHRGASAAEPENSLAAFRKAVAMGADGIELDVHATADAGVVVMHDDVLGGTPIARLTLGQVRTQKLRNGEPIPTLGDALATIGPATTVFVEVKTLAASADASLLRVLEGGPAPARYHLHSFDHRVIRRLQPQGPNRPYGILSCSYPVNPLDVMHAARATELWQHDSLIDAELVRTLHAAGCHLYAWTVDESERMKALRRMGVDGVCTNRPDVARSVLA